MWKIRENNKTKNIMKLTKYQNLALDNTKFMIGELSKMQYAYYDSLLIKLGVLDNEWLFDFLFNGGDDETLEEYLSRFNRTLADI